MTGELATGSRVISLMEKLYSNLMNMSFLRNLQLHLSGGIGTEQTLEANLRPEKLGQLLRAVNSV